jgi:DNA-binding response OmpR family regulator
MQEEGHLVLSAADGDEGLELSRNYPATIDLVITDVEMPETRDSDLCSYLLEERPGIKLLLISSASLSEIGRQNANLLFLTKPFDRQTLKTRVRAILAGPGLVDDATRLLSELRSELKGIDKDILSLEKSETRTRKTGPGSLTDDPEVAS